MNEQQIFLLQLLGSAMIGSLIGEYYRTTFNDTYNVHGFVGNVLASMFISILVAYLFYYRTQNIPFTLIIAAGLSFQEVDFVSSTLRKLLDHWLPGGGGR